MNVILVPQSNLPSWSIVDRINSSPVSDPNYEGVIIAIMNTQKSCVVTSDKDLINPKFRVYINDKLKGTYDSFGKALFNGEKLAV